ncbi:MAG: nucleoside monophosphate kinase [Candidatus Kerfeldbacteria bacterium]|nr:nucleoside monophosphate kinase [Candidatus Kerfeldbacteria bacterium]
MVKRQKFINRIVILGPQGSGKGTQADILAKRLRLPHISTGDIFRSHLKFQTALGHRVQRLIDSGRLVPDHITNVIIKQRISKPDCRPGFILDGFPRTLTQAKFLERIAPPTIVIMLELTNHEAIKRLSGRRIAADGSIYHLKFNPPPKSLRARLFIRDDDRPSAVRKRLVLFRRQVAPLLRFYRSKGRLEKVNAKPPIAKVTLVVGQSLRRRSMAG